jgi:exosortase A
VTTAELVLPARLTSAWLNASAALACSLLLLLALHRATAFAMLRAWTKDPFGHGYFVVAAAACLAWNRRARLAALTPRATPAALPLLGLLSFGWLLGSLTGTESVQQLCLVTMFVALTWAVLGHAALRALLFPLGILVFALPVGDRIAPALQALTAQVAVTMLAWTGVPALLTGHVISIADSRWRVAEACGGINYLTASLAFGYVYAGTVYRQWGHRLAFMLAAGLVPLAGNALRVYTTILLDHLGASGVASGMEHDLYGLFVFATMTAVLLAVFGHWREVPSTVAGSSVPDRARQDSGSAPRVRAALCVTAGMAFVAAGPLSARVLSMPGHRHEVPRQNPLEVSRPWEAVDSDPLGWSPRSTPDADFLQTYKADEQVVRVYVASHDANEPDLTRASAVLDHEPWSPASQRQRSVTIAGQSSDVLETVIGSPRTSLVVWTWYAIDGRFTTSPYLAKLLLAKARLLRRAEGARTIAVATQFRPGVDAAVVLEAFVSHISLPRSWSHVSLPRSWSHVSLPPSGEPADAP